jgi:hypothetical protein
VGGENEGFNPVPLEEKKKTMTFSPAVYVVYAHPVNCVYEFIRKSSLTNCAPAYS